MQQGFALHREEIKPGQLQWWALSPGASRSLLAASTERVCAATEGPHPLLARIELVLRLARSHMTYLLEESKEIESRTGKVNSPQGDKLSIGCVCLGLLVRTYPAHVPLLCSPERGGGSRLHL